MLFVLRALVRNPTREKINKITMDFCDIMEVIGASAFILFYIVTLIGLMCDR